MNLMRTVPVVVGLFLLVAVAVHTASATESSDCVVPKFERMVIGEYLARNYCHKMVTADFDVAFKDAVRSADTQRLCKKGCNRYNLLSDEETSCVPSLKREIIRQRFSSAHARMPVLHHDGQWCNIEVAAKLICYCG